jgi:hypothetical protein
MPSIAEDLYQYVDEHFQITVDLVYEAGCVISTIFFLNLGWNVLVVNPLSVKTEIKNAIKKTDA